MTQADDTKNMCRGCDNSRLGISTNLIESAVSGAEQPYNGFALGDLRYPIKPVLWCRIQCLRRSPTTLDSQLLRQVDFIPLVSDLWSRQGAQLA